MGKCVFCYPSILVYRINTESMDDAIFTIRTFPFSILILLFTFFIYSVYHGNVIIQHTDIKLLLLNIRLKILFCGIYFISLKNPLLLHTADGGLYQLTNLIYITFFCQSIKHTLLPWFIVSIKARIYQNYNLKLFLMLNNPL